MYDYEKEKTRIFTDEGQRLFIQIRDGVKALLAKAGAVRMSAAMDAHSVGAVDTWQTMACVDRLVELGEIREITDKAKTHGQDRVFVEVRHTA